MSYILDALKKSDQQRRRGATPTLLTTQVPAVASRQRSFLWYGLLAAALVGAGVAIGSLRPWNAGPTVPAIEHSAAGHSPETMAYQESAVHRSTPPSVASRSESRMKRPADRAPVAPLPTSALIRPNDAAPPATRQHRAPPKSVAAIPKQAASPAPEKKPAVGAPAKLLTMSELPLSVQQEIPKMSISAHAYASKPKDRLVSINDQLLREGASLAPGLTLEQITPDGMIFTFRGYRFYHGVKNTAATAAAR